jgi:5-formyltetrahydrofolate cyclo-ligase
LSLADLKRAMRSEAMKRRDAIHAELGESADLAIASRDLPVAGAAVSGFHPYKTEISTLPLLDRLAREGWLTALPIVQGKGLPLIFRSWKPDELLVSGLWDIQIPPDTRPIVEPDVLLVPMLAFDAQGYRLGYGGGFYDRTLAALRAKTSVTAIGVAYEAQGMEEVPHDHLDQRLDYIMTERRTFRCG